MQDLGFYVFVLIAIIVAFLLVKKFVGCLIRTVILIILVALLAAVYFMFFAN